MADSGGLIFSAFCEACCHWTEYEMLPGEQADWRCTCGEPYEISATDTYHDQVERVIAVVAYEPLFRVIDGELQPVTEYGEPDELSREREMRRLSGVALVHAP